MSVRIRQDAQHDIADAAQWYEQQLKGLGHQFLDEIQASIQKIAEAPSRYPKVYKSLRRILPRRFPFAVYYLEDKDREQIIVLAILHGNRDPKCWKGRYSQKNPSP